MRSLASLLFVFATVLPAADTPPVPISNFTDPFPPAATRGAPSQPTETIAFFENFEHAASTVPGVIGKAWRAKSDDKLPLVYPLPELLKKPPSALTLEWWMKRDKDSSPPNGTLIHGSGFKVSFSWNQTPYGSMHIHFQHARGGVWIGSLGPELPLPKPDGQWHYYAATYDCRTLAVYVDGDCCMREWQGNNADQIGPMADGTNERDKNGIELGGNAAGRWPDQAFTNVPVADVRISTIALDAWQVRRNFENYRETAVIYASPAGAADADGSLEHPQSLATALKRPGVHHVVLLSGEYSAADFRIENGGASPLGALIISGASGDKPATVNATADAPIVSGAGFITLRNVAFRSTAANGPAALKLQNFQGAARIECCRFSGAGASEGLVIENSPGTRVENCIVSLNGAGACISIRNSSDVALVNNTLVGGASAFSAQSSPGPALLNNIYSAQSRACIAFDGASLHAVRGDGNVYASAPGGALALLESQSFAAGEIDKLRQRLYEIDFPKDKDKKLTAYGPENKSLALNAVFTGADRGDFRLAPTPGNPIGAGVFSDATESSGAPRLEAPLFDIAGARRPGDGISPGAFESLPPLQYSFTLDKPCTGSAGVYRTDGTLVKTLWSGRALGAGPHIAAWNGLDDEGNAAANGEYTIVVAAHNIRYVWEGVIGNSSAALNGPSVHSAFLPIQSMAITGTTCFYVAGYNEGGMTQFRLDTSNPQALTAKIGRADYLRAFNLATTDGMLVYFADTHSPGFVVAANVSDNAPFKFSAGKDSGIWNGMEIPGPEGILGMAVQTHGNLLFVAHSKLDSIFIFDKRTGAAHKTIKVSAPGRIAVDAKGDLWVCCKYEGKPAVVRYSGFDSEPKVAMAIRDVEAPAAVAVSPKDGSILIADAGSVQQLKAFDADGKALWTFGQRGGYDNGPAVTNDKFFFRQTLLAFQPDGSFWVKDEATNRVLHLSPERTFIDAIMYQPHPFTQTTDPNDPTRIFINWLEFKVDYSKPLSEPGAWKLVNFWGHKLPKSAYNGFDDGLYRVVTLPAAGGRTYGFILGGDYSAKKVVELTSAGLRMSAADPLDGKIKMEDDGALTWVERKDGMAIFMRRDLAPQLPPAPTSPSAPSAPLDVKSHDLRWEAPRIVAQAPAAWSPKTPLVAGARWNGGDPVGEDLYFSQWRLLGDKVISYNGERFSAGWHLGAILTGDNRWLWRASPSGPMDGRGTFDTHVEYAGRAHQVAGRHIFFNLHGEFWRSGQSNQFFDYLDNGLFLGQFGQPNIFGVGSDAQQSRVPGAAGNSFNMTLNKVGEKLYLYHNDENGHGGTHRWRIDGWNDVREFSGKVIIAGK